MSTIDERLRERQNKARIRLAYGSGPGLGLIFLRPSGVFYTHEVGGYGCHPALAEGVFAPLHRAPDDDQEALLSDHFTGPKWGGWCTDSIDVETADFVDHVLSLSAETEFLKVDRTRLTESKEAWIYVDVQEPADSEFPLISGFGV